MWEKCLFKGSGNTGGAVLRCASQIKTALAKIISFVALFENGYSNNLNASW